MNTAESDPGATAGAPAARRAIPALLVSLALGSMALGMTGPLVAIVLERAGLSATLIGLNAAMPALALLTLVFALPRLVRAVGAAPAIYAGLALWAAMVLLMPVFSDPGSWLVLRFLLSLGFCVHWVVGEAWINAAADERNRGRVVGAYVTLSALGFAAGPLLLGPTGLAGALPFVVIAGLVGAAAAPLALVPRKARVEMPSAAASLVGALRTAPVVLAMAAVAGFADAALFALLPVYGLQGGLAEGATILLLVAFLAGTATMQLPLGWLAERIPRRALVAACAVLVIIGAAILPRALPSMPALFALMFVWGGAQVGLYTLGLVELGRTFTRSELVGANAVFALMYGVGTLGGPLAAGAVMDALGRDGLPAAIAAAAALFLLLALRKWTRAAGPPSAGAPSVG